MGSCDETEHLNLEWWASPYLRTKREPLELEDLIFGKSCTSVGSPTRTGNSTFPFGEGISHIFEIETFQRSYHRGNDHISPSSRHLLSRWFSEPPAWWEMLFPWRVYLFDPISIYLPGLSFKCATGTSASPSCDAMDTRDTDTPRSPRRQRLRLIGGWNGLGGWDFSRAPPKNGTLFPSLSFPYHPPTVNVNRDAPPHSRCWFETCFLFNPIPGEMLKFDLRIFFGSTTNKIYIFLCYVAFTEGNSNCWCWDAPPLMVGSRTFVNKPVIPSTFTGYEGNILVNPGTGWANNGNLVNLSTDPTKEEVFFSYAHCVDCRKTAFVYYEICI